MNNGVDRSRKEPVILDGNRVAQSIKDALKPRIADLAAQGIIPCLATILVGDDASSATYVRMKGNACTRLGLESRSIHLPASTTTEQLLAVIAALNEDRGVHGILLQHPVPNQVDERAAFEAIRIEKDVDGVTMRGFAENAFGASSYPSCTPAAILAILDYYKIPIEGQHAVVIGRSPILGKPVSLMLLNRNATVTMCHSKTEDLPSHVRSASIIIAAVGKPKFVQADWIRQGAVILDAGYNEGNVGDVDYENCLGKAGAITPVPAGVGPVTIAMLLKHTVDAADKAVHLH